MTPTQTDLQAQIQQVIDYWCSFKGKVQHWHTPTYVGLNIKDVIKFWLKQEYPSEYLCKAIDNYAMVLSSPKGKYTWDYTKWGILQFFTRGKKEQDPRWLWFAEFVEDEWLTKEAKKKIREFKAYQAKQSNLPPVSLKPVPAASGELNGRAVKEMLDYQGKK